MRGVSICIFLSLFAITSFAQNAPKYWYFGHQLGLEFTLDGPIYKGTSGMKGEEGTSIWSDVEGNPLIYSNGVEIYNRANMLMENGSNILGNLSSKQSSLIIPFPGQKNKFFVFTNDAIENSYQHGLNYSIVDLNYNAGLGRVTEKNHSVHKPGTEAMTIIGNCACSESTNYWLISFKASETGKVFAYKIDGKGLNTTPILSEYNGIGVVDYVRFSPNGNLIAFIDSQSSRMPYKQNLVLAYFNPTSGGISNFYTIPIQESISYSSLSFSPNGKFLYLINNGVIEQFDLSEFSNMKVTSTKITEDVGRLGLAQIGPDGKIYIANYDLSFLSIIENPDKKGVGCNFVYKGLILPKTSSWGLPLFSEQLAYNGITADAGPDTAICSNQVIKLGSDLSMGDKFEWSPSTDINDPSLKKPSFKYWNLTDSIVTKKLVLSVFDEFCTRCDTVEIKIYPQFGQRIKGPSSVCPGVEGVEYFVEEKEGYNYSWEIEGGIIAGDSHVNKVTVNWGKQSTTSKLKLFYNTKCVTDSIVFPIRINTLLKTDLPEGEFLICTNNIDHKKYSVPFSPGSTYHWGIAGGTIVNGNGSNSILVDFDNNDAAKIWVEENSTTKDTVCYGVSDTLVVKFYEDTATIKIKYATLDLFDESVIVVAPEREAEQAHLSINDKDFELTPFEGLEDKKIAISYDTQDNPVLKVQVSKLNQCGIPIYSDFHKLISLKFVFNPDSSVNLLWNHYEGWSNVNSYEIWRRVNETDTFKLYKSIAGSVNALNSVTTTDGFSFEYRIIATSDEGFKSYSNSIQFKVNHLLSIPNVFTPNNDNLNDKFVIKNLEFYPDNELAIYNRWGREIYKKSNYCSDWDGNNLSAGVYFYSLSIRSKKEVYNGWVQILY